MLAGPCLMSLFANIVNALLHLGPIVEMTWLIEIVDGPIPLQNIISGPSTEILMVSAHVVDHFLDIVIMVTKMILSGLLLTVLFKHHFHGKVLVPFLIGQDTYVDDAAPRIMTAATQDT